MSSGCASPRWRPAPASPRWCRASRSGCSSSRPRSWCCRATPIRSRRSRPARRSTLGPFLLRVDHLIMLACALALSAGVQLLLYRSRFGLALRAIIDNPVAAHLVGINVKAAVMLRLRARLGDRRHRRLSGARRRPAGHADVRHVGDVQGPDRDDDRRARLDPRRDRSAAWCSASSRRTASGISARRSATSSPISLLFACLVLRPGGLLGAAADARARASRAGSVSDGRLSGRRPLQHRRHLVHRAVGLSAAAHRRDFVRPAGVLRDRRLCGRDRDRAVGLAARRRRSAGAPPSAGAGGRAGRHADAAAARALLRDRDARLRRDGAAAVRAVPLSGDDRRRAGRPERRRRLPRHPLHLRERYRPAAIPRSDLRAARAPRLRASCCWSARASASPSA